jgi:hypothetical protein
MNVRFCHHNEEEMLAAGWWDFKRGASTAALGKPEEYRADGVRRQGDARLVTLMIGKIDSAT